MIFDEVIIMNELASRDCVPCRGGVPPMAWQEIGRLLKELDNWEVIEEHHLRKTFQFKDFRAAL